MDSPKAPTHPFEVDRATLLANLDSFVTVTIADLTSEFLLMPKGSGFIEFRDFNQAYESFKKHTHSFSNFTLQSVVPAIREDSRAFIVLRAMLGLTAPEWADLVRSERKVEVEQGAARALDRDCRADRRYFIGEEARHQEWEAKGKRGREPVCYPRLLAMVDVAVTVLTRGAPPEQPGVVHRMAKFDTQHGLDSVQYAANENVPYSLLL